MNLIVYGSNSVEKNVFEERKKNYDGDSTLYIDDDTQVDEVRSTVRYAPFFNSGWLVVANLAKLSHESRIKVIALVNNPLVSLYARIPNSKKFNKPNKELYDSLARSSVIKKLPNLELFNTLYPSKDYLKNLIFNKLKGVYLSDQALHYLIENLRFKLDEFDSVIDEIKDTGEKTMNIDDIKRILPRTANRSLKHYVYTVLLSHREDLKEMWDDKDKRILTQNAGTKEKPYKILSAVDLQPKDSLNIIISILRDMVRLKQVYQNGVYTLNGIFEEKENLEKRYPVIKALSIPTIIDYSKVFSEVSKADLLYVLTSFMKLKSQVQVSADDLYLVTKKLMSRFERSI